MAFPLWVPWAVAVAVVLTALIATTAEPKQPIGRRARWWPVPVVATVVAVSMSVDRLHVSDEELTDAVRHAVDRLPSQSGDDVDKVVALAEAELGRDLTWDAARRDDGGTSGGSTERRYTITVLDSERDPDREPAACLEVTVYRQTAGYAAAPTSYTANRDACSDD